MANMNTGIEEYTVRPIRDDDHSEWRPMWAEYCAFYQVIVPDTVTETTWQRILDPASAVCGIIARGADGKALGFANYVLHPHTWSEKTLCYLEDLYVRPETRGRGVGYRLIEHLIALGRECDWNRVYWHTDTDNAVARRLYDRFKLADDYVRYTVSLTE
jgi:GNAT superfamily N-acetyltransferase